MRPHRHPLRHAPSPHRLPPRHGPHPQVPRALPQGRIPDRRDRLRPPRRRARSPPPNPQTLNLPTLFSALISASLRLCGESNAPSHTPLPYFAYNQINRELGHTPQYKEPQSMSTLEVSPADTLPLPPTLSVTNDFSIQVATVNGSGSQTANTVLMRAIFQMGIPVSGKNMFPSNIAGLPTWFTIRVRKHGYIGRRKEIDFLVAMNPETAREDVLKLDSGSAVVYDEPLKLDQLRSDLHFFPVPFVKLVAPVCPDAKLRKLVRNMIYDGVVAKLLSIEMEEIRHALLKQFGKKKAKAAELNWGACQAGFEYATKTFTEPTRWKVERMNETAGKIILDGNAACALGCMFAGCTVVTWYPITPSSSLVETMIGYMKRFRLDPETGKATYAIVQAEDELASIGMALGAGWAGARSM